MSDGTGTRALVLGGSIAGLFAARVLSETYDEVQIIDRDVLVGTTTPRRRCPQTYQANGLQARGAHIMEELFPGITDELINEAGVPAGDLSGTCRWYARGMRLKQADGGLIAMGVLRPTLELHIRQRVQKLPNVVFVEEHDILGLTATADNSRITGARVQARNEKSEKVIDADLVVDATGRGSRTPVWLEELGYDRPEEERKKIDLVYVTQHYQLREGADPFQGDTAINQIAHKDLLRGNVFFKTDKGWLELTAYGLLGQEPPTDQAALYEYVKSLGAKDVYETLRYADPVDEPVLFRFPTTLRRHYQKLDRFPTGLLVTGDAVTCFNPVYAGGMSVAALCALVIRQHLHSGAAPIPADFFHDLAEQAIDAQWEMTNTVDLSFPGVKGDRPLKVKIANWYLKRMQVAATRDEKVTRAYFTAASMVASASTLTRPGMFLRVLLKSLPGPTKESRKPYVWVPPADVEPVFGESVHVPDAPRAAEVPKAA